MGQLQLVITIALKNELGPKPKTIPVFTYKQLSQDKSLIEKCSTGSIILITGVGQEQSKKAAQFIATEIRPLYVVNIGTAGTTTHTPLDIFLIEQITGYDGTLFQIGDTCPLPLNLKKERLYSSTAPCYSNSEIPENIALVDMEAAAQADIFQTSPIHFSCIKIVSDRISKETATQFQTYLPQIQDAVARLLEPLVITSPKISVIIPTYNRPEQTHNAIRSVLNQTYPVHECIIVDDGSTPTLEATLGADLRTDWNKQYATIKVIKHTQNKGVSAARNTGINNSTGDWLAFLDSDDEWHTNKLDTQVDYLKCYPFYRVLQSHDIWVRNGVRVNKCHHHQKPVGWAFKQSLEQCLIAASSVMIKRDVFDAYGQFDTTLPACEDYDLWCRICRYFPVGLDPTENMTRYAGHTDQLSKKYPAMDRFRLKTLDRLLKTEQNNEFKNEIQRIRDKKWKILENGAKKRSNSIVERIQ